MTAPTKTPASAPVNEIGYQQAVGQYMWWLYENETTPELIWPQSVYVYDQMRRTDSQVGSILRAVNLLVLRTPWRIDPNGARDEVVQLVADDLGLPIVGQNPKAPPRTKGRFSWKEHLSEALLMLPIGYSYFEQVYQVDPDGNRAHLRKLALRPARTIEYVNVAQDGGLVSIKQYWIRTGERPQPIPVERLVAYIHAKEGGNWLGTSILRNCYKNWLLKDRLLRVQAQTIERNGMGIPLYTGQEGASDLSGGLAMAKGWRAGDAAGTAIPFGASLKLVGVEGTLPDAEPAIRYHDESIAKTVLAHFLNLGQQMGTGSYALGATLGDFFTLGVQTVAQQIADTGTCHIIEDLVDINFGEDEPAPRLTFDEIGSRQAATAQALKLLIDVGVIHPDDILEESTRQQYGLPPRDPNAPPPGPLPGLMRETLTGPAPSGTAAPPVVNPKAVAAEAAEAVTAKFNPGELRVGGGEHGGEWTATGALKDALKLDGKMRLDDGEKLVGSDSVKADFGTIRVAATEHGGARSLRFGVGDSAFGSRDDEAGPWRGDNGTIAEENAARRRVVEEMGQLEREDADLNKRRDPLVVKYRASLNGGPPISAADDAELDRLTERWNQIDARLSDLADASTAEVYASGHTVKLDGATASRLRDVLADANARAKAAEGPHATAWDAIPTGSTTAPYTEIAKGSIPAEWGAVHYETFLEEPESGPQTHLWVVPDGMTSEEVRNAEQSASLDATELAKLVRLLDKMLGSHTVQASAFAYDEATDALIAALAEFSGEVTASEFDPIKHPRGPGGRFRSTFDKVMHALGEWSKGDGHDDPLKDFNREQLRTVAVKRGITLKRGALREDIARAILDDLKVDVRTKRDNPAPKPAAKFTLKGEVHRNKDVAVYHEADGRVSLYEQSDSGVRGARVMTAPDLAGLEKWANDNGETELADWARKEQGADVPAPVAKKPAASRKAAPRKRSPKTVAPLEGIAAQDSAPVRWDYDSLSLVASPDSWSPAERDQVAKTLKNWAYDKVSYDRARAGESTESNPESKVNAALRGMVPMTPALETDIETLDRIFGDSKLPAPIVAYRGFTGSTGILPEGWQDRDLAGLTWDNDAFTSVTVDRDAAEAYSGYPENGGFAIRVHLPAGSSAFAVLDVNPESPNNEGELVLPRGMEFRVTKDNGIQGDYGIRWLDVEVISRKPSPVARKAARRAPAKKAMPEAPSAPDLTGANGLSTDPAIRPVQIDNRVREAYAKLAAKPGAWVGLADLRNELGEGVNRHEVDASLRRLEQEPGANIVPESNQKTLTQADRDAAVVIGDQAKHAITLQDPSPHPVPGAAPATKAAPRKATSTPEAALADLRALNTETRRDALDLRKVGGVNEPDSLKGLLKAQGLPVSGRKRDLVDRLVEHLDGAGAPNVRPKADAAPSTSTAPKVTGRDISGEVDYASLPTTTYNFKTGEDDTLKAILAQQGFDALPQVVSRADFDAAVARGEVHETWRGLSSGGAVNARVAAEQVRSGPPYVGAGINGDGMYVAQHQSDAQIYGAELLRIGLRRDARVISIEQLYAEMDAHTAKQKAANIRVENLERQLLADLAKAKSPRARANLRRQFRNALFGLEKDPAVTIQRDPGRFAALRGYDAIDIPKAQSPDKHREWIILNRGATIVQEA